MKVTRQELEFRVKRTLNNFYNYIYSPGEKARKQTEFYFLINDLRSYKSNGGDVFDFKDSFLLKLLDDKGLKEEQKDFLFDIIDVINDNCSGHLSLS
ncbi:hypothetical protein [uncultured Psychroserpens sp.]|uniref:hypothetical protein n=1 Tax=uncultured Psychroserpens sp. TaxID=255436 RepID=UPI002615AA9A|nr:hypothetical protein [uncultured Psychroserpens sp.]